MAAACALIGATTCPASRGAAVEPFVNSVGLKLVPIAAGSFIMGAERGEFDERPIHDVTLTRPFYLAATPVTNAQYELFDPEHRRYRGRHGLARDDDEAVLFVSWRDATAYCRWLSEREGKPYRLPTEAEWEYACRAETTTRYWTGPDLPAEYRRAQEFDWFPRPVSLHVGETPANPWGLHDVHGLVEEWCLDGYGPYEPGPATDPVGRDSEMRVTRGGSHNSELEFLRSANRGGALPDDRSWLIGFRVAQADSPTTQPLPAAPVGRWGQEVRQETVVWPEPSDRPLWQAPRSFVHIAPDADGPLYARHNHCPAITWCPNGDLLAAWFSCRTERGREMTIAASRLRWGASEWDAADEFFKAPDRNMTGTALWHDGAGRILHFNGIEAGHGWATLALALRTSADNGATWQTRYIDAEHQPHNQVIANLVRTRAGRLILACDAVYGGNGGTAIHLSDDDGATWRDPSHGKPPPKFVAGGKGAWIAGIHGALVELADGSYLAYGRGDSIDGHMPLSRSTDGGETWTYEASDWPAISGGQRLVLRRLNEGPLLFCSFTDASGVKEPRGLAVVDAAGCERRVYGLFAALSFDDGKTWPVVKGLTPGAGSGPLNGGAWTGEFQPDATHAEPRGYLACTQTPDGAINLVSSALHYRFNLAWLRQPMAAQ
ncbi:MAG: SUMF1/EgtB/PvdO family nonheme iron enzyme [Armatimonadetes bacterium]|nr:SUMF1/EgtB/PvdO family nonheme iron enzyme [Armatimonadota bacterium]